MPRLKLTGPQRQRVSKALRAAFAEASLKTLLQSIDREFDDYVPSGYDLRQQVTKIVQDAEQESWLAQLINAAFDMRDADAELESIRDMIAGIAAVTLPEDFDPLRICCLAGEYVMVNRAKLRGAMENLLNEQGKRILIVRDVIPSGAAPLSSTRSGKSLSAQFISEIGRIMDGHYHPVFFDLQKFQDAQGIGNDISPRELARSLTLKLDYDGTFIAAPPSDAQWSRWNFDFFAGFEARGRADKRKVWIVIDEFNKAILPQATQDFVKGLATLLKTDLPHFRLVLLGYRDLLIPELGGLIVEEQIDRAVSAKDLVGFFIDGMMQRSVSVKEEMLEAKAFGVLDGLDATSATYLEEIGRRAWQALESLT